MSTDPSSSPAAAQKTSSAIARLLRRRWTGAAILLLGAATIAVFQAVRIIDNAMTNIATFIAFGVTFILLGFWTAFFAPISRSARWRRITIPLAVLAVLSILFRKDYFTGNLIPHFTWRWVEVHDAALGAMPTTTGQAAADVAPTALDYPAFLGANRDAFIPDVRLSTDWKTIPPKLLWRQPIGAGWSAFSVVGDAAITLEQRGEEELVTCYDLKTGALIWRHSIKARHENEIGGDGPSSTPTIRDSRVYALGGTGVLRCLDAATGQPIWTRDVLADVGTTYELDRVGVSWSRSASPLVVDDLIVVPGGGTASGPKFSLIAYDKRDGNIVWKGGNRQVSYSSPSLATFGGVRQIVIVNEDTISAHDPQTGAVLWETKWDGSSSSSASCPQTVQVADDRFFVSKGYSAGGGALYEVKQTADGTWKVEQLWHNRRVLKTKLNNVVIVDGSVYGLSDGILECVDLQTGERRWAGEDYGHGQLLRVGDLLLVTHEWGGVSLVALDPTAFRELARFQAIEGKTWNNPALAGNRLLVRNALEAACYELPLAN